MGKRNWITVSGVDLEQWKIFRMISDYRGFSASKLIREYISKTIDDSKNDKDLTRFINIRKKD